MWWRTVLVFSLTIRYISTQNDTIGTETPKLCCPCPPGWLGNVTDSSFDVADSGLPAPGLAPASGLAVAPAVARDAGGMDDCPCRARDADSEGAASLFVPHAVRAFGNVVRPDPKEDSKPLLHPEVDLASSVLETLREATNEEYRDALERDAARSADLTSISDVQTDGDQQESRNVVTIIVSPRDMDGSDDAEPDASHVQETRCVDSLLGNPKASSYRAPIPRKGLEDILNLPLPSGLLHRQRDNGFAASSVHESFVGADDNLNKLLPRLKLKSEPNLLKLDPKSKSENINDILRGTNLGIDSGSNNDRSGMDNTEVEIESYEQISSKTVEENEHILAEKDFNSQQDSPANLDCNTSPSTNLETVLEKSAQIKSPLKSLLFARNNAKKPDISFPLKNLFKLKDVELIPLDILSKPKTKINIPSLKLDPSQKSDQRSGVVDPIKFPTKSLLKHLPKLTTLNNLNRAKSANVQIIPKRKVVKTDILDAVPSPSDENCVKLKPQADTSTGIDMEQLEDSLLESSTEINESADEKASDIIAKSTDTFNSGENIQSESSEIFQNEQNDDSEDFQIIDNPVQESASDIEITSPKDIGDAAHSSVDLSEINEGEDRGNTVSISVNPHKTLEDIRKSIVDRLEALQKSNRNALDLIEHVVEELPFQRDSVEERSRGNNFSDKVDTVSNVEPTFQIQTSEISIKEELEDKSASAESVSFQDLQNMSDSILQASKNHEQRAQATNNEFMAESKEDNSLSEEVAGSETDSVIDSEDAGLNAKDDLEKSTDGSDKVNADKELCPSDLFKTSDDKFESSKTFDKEDDLDTLASDPIMHIVGPTSLKSEPIINILGHNSKSIVEHLHDFGSKLRQSIVQPAPLINADDFNIFRTPSFNIPDISALHTNIPTLDDIRTRVSKILDGLARTANDDDDSCELDSEDFASEDKPVLSTGASTSDPVSIFPPLKPLEDINLDIIQLKPLPSLLGSSPEALNLPGLNLNRYKAKLAIPPTLDLKPLNLASTFGNNGGLVGTTLTIGPEKKEKNSKARTKPNKNTDIVSSRGALNNINLADITSTMQKNALTLLNIPKGNKNPRLQTSNVMENLAEKIKSRTEETVKSIHETLNPSTLLDVHNNAFKNDNKLLTLGRNPFQKTLQKSSPVDSMVDNLRSRTQNTFQQLQSTLQSPRVASLSNVISKNTHSILTSPKNTLDAAVDNLKAQSQSTFKNIQQTLDTSRLADISNSIQKNAKTFLKSSPVVTSTRNVLGNTVQAVPTIDEVSNNLRSHTQNSLKNIQKTLNTPSISDISTSIQKSAKQVLKLPITNNRPDILKSALQPSTSSDTVVDNLRSQTQNTMRTIQNSLSTPTLADISTTVQKHAQNLLQSPVAFTGRDAFQQVLQASSPIPLTHHAEQVAKDLQKTLKATLKSSPFKDLPPLPHPKDVIQIISNHHEDVNDKLHALHTDLTDRLESIHNEVTDPERLRSILSPPGNRDFELFSIPLPMSSRTASITKQVRPSLQATQPAIAFQKKQPKKTSITSRSRTETANQSPLRASMRKANSSPKSFRIPPPAASVPVPERVERPTLSLSPKKTTKGMQDIKKPVLPKLKPLSKNKVTITFGSTTLRPPVAKQKGIATTPKPKVSTNRRFKPKGPVRQPTPWSEGRGAPKQVGKPLTSPITTTPSLRTPWKSKTIKPVNTPVKSTSRLSPVPSKLKSQPKASLPSAQGRTSTSSQSLGVLNKPKSPLLAKLADSLRNPTVSTLSQTPRARGRNEMAPAASERLEKVVALEEPMKENVSYKCKMMCVKVDLSEE